MSVVVLVRKEFIQSIAALSLFFQVLTLGCQGGPPAGIWRGEVEQPGIGAYQVTLSLKVAKAGEIAGVVEYPSRQCWTELTFIEKQENNKFIYREKVSPPSIVQKRDSDQSERCPDGRKITLQETDDEHLLAQWDSGKIYGSLSNSDKIPPLSTNKVQSLLEQTLASVNLECRGGYHESGSNNRRGFQKFNPRRDPGFPPFSDVNSTYYVRLEPAYARRVVEGNRRTYSNARSCVSDLQRAGAIEETDESAVEIRYLIGSGRSSATRFRWNSSNPQLTLHQHPNQPFTYYIRMPSCGSLRATHISRVRSWAYTATAAFGWSFDRVDLLRELPACNLTLQRPCGNVVLNDMPEKGEGHVFFIYEEGNWTVGGVKDVPFVCSDNFQHIKLSKRLERSSSTILPRAKEQPRPEKQAVLSQSEDSERTPAKVPEQSSSSEPSTTSTNQPLKITPDRVAASSYLSSGPSHYPPIQAFDGSLETAWAEGQSHQGENEWIEAEFNNPYLIQRIELTTGYEKHHPRAGDLFYLNPHLRQLRIEFDGGQPQMRNIERDQRRLVLEGLAITSSKVRFIASQVWPGSRFQDLSISEISIQGSSKGNGTAKNRDLTRVLPKKTAGFKRQASKQPGERVRRRYRPQEW